MEFRPNISSLEPLGLGSYMVNPSFAEATINKCVIDTR